MCLVTHLVQAFFRYRLPIVALSDIDFAMACAGILVRVGADRQYGWILPDGETKELFVHNRQCNNASKLKAGDHVTFDTNWSDKKGTQGERKLRVNNCTIIGFASCEQSAQKDKFDNDRNDWPRRSRRRCYKKWKHNKWESMRKKKQDDETIDLEDDSDDDNDDENCRGKRAKLAGASRGYRIPPRYTAPLITLFLKFDFRPPEPVMVRSSDTMFKFTRMIAEMADMKVENVGIATERDGMLGTKSHQRLLDPKSRLDFCDIVNEDTILVSELECLAIEDAPREF